MRRLAVGLRPLVLAAILPLSPRVAAQQPQPLGRPIAEFPEPFSAVGSLRELSNGRLLVTDTRERTVQLLDLRRGTATPISREGAGPGEFRFPGALLALPNDHTLMTDIGNQRFLRFGPDGKVVETISPVQLPASATPGVPADAAGFFGRLTNPRGVDAQGRLYFQAMTFAMGDTPQPDSVPIYRWSIGQTRVDTAGWARMPPSTGGRGLAAPAVTGARAATVAVRIGGGSGVIWEPAEIWQVAPNGRIARLSPAPYQLTWLDPAGRPAVGPSVPYTPVRVTEADREAFRRGLQNAAGSGFGMTVAIGAAAPAAGSSRGSSPPPPMPGLEFAETLPPFWESGAIRTTPGGLVWVQRLLPARERNPLYDVFDAAGRLVHRVTLAPGSRVVGFGRSSVYVVRKDEDDLEYLQQFALPGPGGR